MEPTQVVVPIEIGLVGRWNARALLECLSPYRSFLIQQGPEQWVVHAQVPGCHGEDMEAAIAAIEECLDEREVKEVSIRVEGRAYPAGATTARSLS